MEARSSVLEPKLNRSKPEGIIPIFPEVQYHFPTKVCKNEGQTMIRTKKEKSKKQETSKK